MKAVLVIGPILVFGYWIYFKKILIYKQFLFVIML